MNKVTIIPDQGEDKREWRYQRNRVMFIEGKEDGKVGDYIRQDFDSDQDREFYDLGYLAGVSDDSNSI